MKKSKCTVLALICAAALSAVGCSSYDPNVLSDETEAAASSETSATAAENMVKSNSAALLTNSTEELMTEPFSSYTYDFAVYDSNYMITVTPDETGAGLTLTVEDNSFGFSTFTVSPPADYIVCLPYSQEYASTVCSVIKGAESGENVPDLLKIDFYLNNFEDESLPYTVSRLYSILDNRLVEVEVYDDTEGKLERMDYIPESYLYRTEALKFMPAPEITVNESGALDVRVKTYALNPHDMTMTMGYEKIGEDNMLYYGYMAHAAAGEIYKYFKTTSLNVSDYENYVEVPGENGEDSRYFFKVDDPRFSDVDGLREYVSGMFSEKLVDSMFMNAPQMYRDIDGELYTILGDGGFDFTLGKLTITGWEVNGNEITYHTKQEKFSEEGNFTGYADGGDFVINVDFFSESAEVYTAEGFTVTKYRYPSGG